MAVYSSITGKRRRVARRYLPRKKRASMSSTPASQLYANQAMEQFEVYMTGVRLHMSFLSVLLAAGLANHPEMAAVFGSLLLGGSYLFSCAMSMVRLDSELMDLEEEDIENAGYYRPLQGIDLDTFENDDECEEKCRLPKHAIKQLLMSLPVGEYVQVYYHEPSDLYYKFKTEELIIYMLRKMSTGRTHKDLSDMEFGGDSKRWGTGYNWIVKLFDTHFAPLIGPNAIHIWADQLPDFAESIRAYMMRPRVKKDRDGNIVSESTAEYFIEPGTWNVF
jgi:hypothetical protein